MIGSNYEDFLHRDDAEEGNRMAMEMLDHPDGFDPSLGPPSDPSLIAPAYVRLLTADGRYLPMESRGNIHLSNESVGGIHFVLRDVTDLQMQDRLLTLIAEDAPLPAIITAVIATVTAQVPGVAASLVLPFAEGCDVPPGAERHERMMLTAADEAMDARAERHVELGAGEPWGSAAVLPLTSPDGDRALGALIVWTRSAMRPPAWTWSILNHLARLGSIGLTRVSDMEHLRRVASVDPLTGLANRREFERSVREAAAGAPTRWAVLYVDLDGFKLVNDVYGHEVGDLVLVETGRRLSATMRAGDVVARMGGDEFTVLSGGLDSAMDAHRMAERVRAAMEPPMRVPGIEVDLDIGASVGMSTTDLPTDVHRLIGRAYVHMYATKAMRRSARKAEADQRDGVAPSSISS